MFLFGGCDILTSAEQNKTRNFVRQRLKLRFIENIRISSLNTESPNNTYITVDNLTMAYGDFVVQKNLNFTIKRGEIFIVMGDSGCGKSTLLRHMIGLQRPASGEILIGEENYWQLNADEQKKMLHKLGVLFQSGALFSSLTLAENVALPLQQYTKLDDDEITHIAHYKLSLVGLAGFEDFFPAQISGGMQKRAGLARAMALDPDILFFDEPSAGLDPISAKRLDNLILEIRESAKTTIVVVTHELASIYDIADNAVFLDADEKTMTAIGNPHELVKQTDNKKLHRFLTREA